MFDFSGLSGYGVTRAGMRESMLHSALITAAGLAVVTFLGLSGGTWGLKEFSFAYVAYYVLLSAPLQEFFFRGLVQTRLERVMRPALAVPLAALIFGAVHLVYSVELVLLTLAAGLAWGYSFHRQRNLIGPWISHSILGLYLFSFVM